ncbi:MAG: type IV secretion system DNA-binding domain-containing protein [Candidatus Vogelbacteria bacterium]|nr:type IV secretion system DNA-binding domain-containing protein [Candidatus Vogelbacteria bacterium]
MVDSTINYFAQTDFRGKHIPFGIKGEDRARHVYVIGKTGMGKSCLLLLENMAVPDIQNGEGMAFIDPHGKSADLLLDFVPEARMKDVIYFAPFDLEHPISFNIMEDVGADQRHLVANGLMSSFKKIWPDVWSSRMEYILNNCLLALLEYPDSTLLGVNRLLSDKDYRKLVVDNITDPSVRSFWLDEFAKYNERYMQEAGDAIKNKIGQFTANPLIRNIIGQTKSSFNLREAMDNKKILIVNLSKGRLGEQNANLLGGILITKIYLAAMSRAGAGAGISKLPHFYVFVDEFQSFVNESFADILSEARKYKLSLTIAHQYVEQMPEEVRNAVFGNIGTTIAFRVGPFDAELLEKIFLPTFTQEDLVNLGFAQIYLTLMIDGVGSSPFSAVTLPPIVPTNVSITDKIIANSQKVYASPREKVEANINTWFEPVVKFIAKTAPIKPLPTTVIKKSPMTVVGNAPAPVFTSTPKPIVPPKSFSLNILKNKTPEINKNKDELKAFLSEIMANKKPKLVSPTTVIKKETKEIPQEVLEDLLKIKPD